MQMKLNVAAQVAIFILATFLTRIDAASFYYDFPPIYEIPKTTISRPSISNADILNPSISNADVSHPNISNAEISNSKISKFQFSINVNYEEVKGLNNLLSNLPNFVKEISIPIETKKAEKGSGSRVCNAFPKGGVESKFFGPKTYSEFFTENIPLKDVTAAESYEPGYYPAKFGNDGDIFSFYHSKLMRNPFWIASLGNTYKVVNITFYSRPDLVERSIGVQFYVADDITFDTNGDPDFSYLTLFSERKTPPIGTDASIHEVPKGHCGNQVLVIKPVGQETYLEVAELQVSGYVCDCSI